MDSSHDFYLHLLMAECYPVNGAVKMGHVMKPPRGNSHSLRCSAALFVRVVYDLCFPFELLE